MVSLRGENLFPVVSPNQEINISWDPQSLVPDGYFNNIMVDISFVFLRHSIDTFHIYLHSISNLYSPDSVSLVNKCCHSDLIVVE